MTVILSAAKNLFDYRTRPFALLRVTNVAAKTAADRDLIQRQIDATDKQIDTLVYQLYGLTDEEIKIVKGNG